MVSALAGVLAIGCGGSSDGTRTTGGGSGTSGNGGSGTSGNGTGGNGGAAGNIIGQSGSSGGGAGATGGTSGGGSGGGAGATGCTTDCEPVCRDKAEGVYAMKVELDVYWRDEVNTATGGGELADPGRGKINIYFRGKISEVGDDGNGKGLMHPCGTELPPFIASASCAAIQIEFPDAMWDNAAVPDFETTGHTTGFAVGDVLTVAKTMGFLGLSLNPSDAFPDAAATPTLACPEGTGTVWTNGQAPVLADAPCFPDHDGDGNPGVTVTFKNDKTTITGPYDCNIFAKPFTFNGAPLGLLSVIPSDTTGAKSGWIGLQTELGGEGKIKDATCSSGVGSAEAGEGLPSRVLHCMQNGGAECQQTDSKFLNENTPNYHILQAGQAPPAEWKFAGTANTARDAKLDHSASVGPRSSVIRLGDLNQSFDCAAIRDTQFLPFE